MKALIEQFLGNPAIITAAAGALATLFAWALQEIVAKYQDRKWVATMVNAAPVAVDVFWQVEKAVVGGTPTSGQQKSLLFAQKFAEQFAAKHGKVTTLAQVAADTVKGDLLTALNAGDSGKK